MGKIKKKYESGEGTLYLTRKQALRKLQLSLKMFRRLCILKGIYPREPKNRKRAQQGSTDKKTLYLKKDIQFLLHEPIVWKLREHKVYLRKKARARATRDYEGMKRIAEAKPTYSLDHIVKERYPTFVDAIRDLDDCLTLTFLFSTFPSMRFVPGGVSALCRRLSLEFLHYIIETRSLRKVFVSIKGYYYQADIKGQTITWIMPHTFGFLPQSPDAVDFRIMATFVEFYSTLLGFVNFRLYHGANICYPPKLTTTSGMLTSSKSQTDEFTEEELISERIASLNQTIIHIQDETSEGAGAEMDEFTTEEDNNEKIAELKREAEKLKRLKTLFNGLKVFLNREVPRESLTLCLRAFGATVSWDSELYPGATFDENDETITHQVVDRDGPAQKQYLSRYYIQPQWIFDSINATTLLPVDKYFQGAVLPPHVSPFAVEREGDYVPTEKRKFLDMEKGIVTTDEVFSVPEGKEVGGGVSAEGGKKKKKKNSGAAPEEEPVKMGVERAEVEIVDELKQLEEETKEEYRLRVMMIRNKHKRLYKKMMESRGKRRKEAQKMMKKREIVGE